MPSARLSRLLLLGIWAATCAILIYANWSDLGALDFRDPDDALRLVQVRDLLAGQSWFDLTQYRIAPPGGILMHWSRLVDLPIAALISAVQPFTGTAAAERIALVVVPLLLLLALMTTLYRLRVPLGLSHATALIACLLLVTSYPTLLQFMPQRIDHHGWQILLGTIAVLGLLQPDNRGTTGSAIAGVAMAGWMQVSIEGLPYAAAFGGIVAVRDILRAQQLRMLTAYLVALTLTSAVLLPIGHGGLASFAQACDAMSPSFLLPLAASTIALLVSRTMIPPSTITRNAISVGIAAIAGGICFALLSRNCLAGPFDTLDPIVYRQWYLLVPEGMPITSQSAAIATAIVLPALVGTVGALLAWRTAKSEAQRDAWLVLIAVQIVAFIMSLDMLRAMGFAHVVALPGNAWLLVRLFGAVQQLNRPLLRVLATTASIIFTPLGAVAATTTLIGDTDNHKKLTDEQVKLKLRCATAGSMSALDELPHGRVFAPLDLGAHILAYSRLDVVASGHHRNIQGMAVVIRGFLAPPDKAEAMVRATGATYIAYCPLQSEVERYAENAPNGLMAQLGKNNVPAWLRPVPLADGSLMRVYRLVPPPVLPER